MVWYGIGRGGGMGKGGPMGGVGMEEIVGYWNFGVKLSHHVGVLEGLACVWYGVTGKV